MANPIDSFACSFRTSFSLLQVSTCSRHTKNGLVKLQASHAQDEVQSQLCVPSRKFHLFRVSQVDDQPQLVRPEFHEKQTGDEICQLDFVYVSIGFPGVLTKYIIVDVMHNLRDFNHASREIRVVFSVSPNCGALLA